MDTNFYSALAQEASQLARAAGEVQMKLFRSAGLEINTKSNEFDVVTTADKRSEQIITEYIKEHHPGHSILSEESGFVSHDSDWTWVVDPLDGTTNFSCGLPWFNVSIAIKHRGETVAGVVFAPALNELFCATKGGGATLNGIPIHPGVKQLLSQAVVSTGFPYDKATNPVNNMAQAAAVTPLVRGIRRIGSAAMELCYIGAGFLDAYWEMNLRDWDIAAGALIAKEAGAVVEAFRHDRNHSLVAGNRAMVNQLLPLIR